MIGGRGRGEIILNILDLVPQANIFALLEMREVREREEMYFQAEQCFPAYLVGYKQNREEADRMETLIPPSLPTGQRGTARELSSKANNSCSQAGVVFLRRRSFSKEALNSMNLPGFNLMTQASQPCQQAVTWSSPVPAKRLWGSQLFIHILSLRPPFFPSSLISFSLFLSPPNKPFYS